MTGGSSMKLMIRMIPPHLLQTRGSTSYIFLSKGGMQEIAHEPLSCCPFIRLDRVTPED